MNTKNRLAILTAATAGLIALMTISTSGDGQEPAPAVDADTIAQDAIAQDAPITQALNRIADTEAAQTGALREMGTMLRDAGSRLDTLETRVAALEVRRDPPTATATATTIVIAKDRAYRTRRGPLRRLARGIRWIFCRR